MSMFSGVPDFFGLDIGTSAIRVVQLRGRGPNRTVFRYGTLALEQQSNRNDDATLMQLAEKIRELLVQSQITTRNAVVGLPTERIYSTVKKFDSMSHSDFVKTLKFQIKLIIPTDFQDSKVDWAVLDADIKDAPQKEVFFCSAKNDYIQKRLEMLESINLNVLAFEPDVLALIRAMATADLEQASMFIDIGFNDTDIVIVHKNQPRLITPLTTGIFHILKSIINVLRVDQVQGQQLLFQIGMQGGDSYKALTTSIMQTFDNLLAQIRKSIGYFVSRYPESRLSQIVLCGDAVYVPGFAEFLHQQTNLPVVVGDAWQNVVCPPQILEELKPLSTNFTVATGLAERQVI